MKTNGTIAIIIENKPSSELAYLMPILVYMGVVAKGRNIAKTDRNVLVVAEAEAENSLYASVR